MAYFGRRKIHTMLPEINRGNVCKLLTLSSTAHMSNASEIDSLYRIYTGEQDILKRTKTVRPEIVNRVVENHANEIVTFKVGYLLSAPVQYISIEGDEKSKVSEDIIRLNSFMVSEEKAAKDTTMMTWAHICGTSYRMVKVDDKKDADEAPFEIYTLDPRNTYVVYSNEIGEEPVAAVHFSKMCTESGVEHTLYDVYTDTKHFVVQDMTTVVKEEDQILGIPIVEYPLNFARVGAFEVVLSLLDSINNVESNRIDGIEQFIQSLMILHNVDFDGSTTIEEMRQAGAVKIKDMDSTLKGDIKYLVEELDQTQTQTLIDDLHQNMLTICGMPNRNGGSSTSDTGKAVILRDGYADAETRAKQTEAEFTCAERLFLKKVLKICEAFRQMSIKPSQIEVRFPRQNYEDIVQRANVLTTVLGCDKVAPILAFQMCGAFPDPNFAAQLSADYVKEREAQMEKQMLEQARASKENEDGRKNATDPGSNRSNQRNTGKEPRV